MRRDDPALIQGIHERAVPLRNKADLKPLVDELSHARVVMLGESSHGTQEFYEWRRLISEWLIVKHGFQLIAVEGDWPPCWELNQYIHLKQGQNAREVLEAFNRWPTWMWANTEVVRLAEWMRTHNETVANEKRVGFFGLDVYSLFESMDVVLKQLEKINPFLARRARHRYECFNTFRHDERAYAKSLLEIPEGCEKEVIDNLRDLLELRLNGSQKHEEILFDATQNARIIVNAERYYRTMMHGNEDSWNVRDRHMIDTLDLLLQHAGPQSKVIVWAHNTHIGDYRATEMAREGQVNLGGLARQKWGSDQVALLGFGTYEGKVIASHAWDGPIEKMTISPGKPGSFEAAFHSYSVSQNQDKFFISFRDQKLKESAFSDPRGHRAIGVVYHPAYEHFGNYVSTSLYQCYDAFLFVDKTTAIEPIIQPFEEQEIPETWPRGQ